MQKKCDGRGLNPGLLLARLFSRWNYPKWEGGELNHYSTVTDVGLQGFLGSDVLRSGAGGRWAVGCSGCLPSVGCLL